MFLFPRLKVTARREDARMLMKPMQPLSAFACSAFVSASSYRGSKELFLFENPIEFRHYLTEVVQLCLV